MTSVFYAEKNDISILRCHNDLSILCWHNNFSIQCWQNDLCILCWYNELSIVWWHNDWSLFCTVLNIWHVIPIITMLFYTITDVTFWGKNPKVVFALIWNNVGILSTYMYLCFKWRMFISATIRNLWWMKWIAKAVLQLQTRLQIGTYLLNHFRVTLVRLGVFPDKNQKICLIILKCQNLSLAHLWLAYHDKSVVLCVDLFFLFIF